MITTKHLLVGAFLVFYVGQCLAQEAGANKKYRVDYKAQAFDVTSADNTLKITLSNQGERDVVAIAAAPTEKKIKVMGWVLSYSTQGDGLDMSHVKDLQGIESLPDSSFSLKDGELTAAPAKSSPASRTVIHVTVPANCLVNLWVNGQLVSAGPIANGVLAKGGKLREAKHGVGPKYALLEAMTDLPSAGQKVNVVSHEDAVIAPPASRPDLPFLVSWNKLKKLAVTAPAFSYSGGQDKQCANCDQAVLQIVVGQTGQVTESVQLSGNKEIAEAAKQALLQWRFQPFVVDGHAVKVQTVIGVKAVNGRLKIGNNVDDLQ